ncbi:hypothetical protein P9809_004606, partial [Salmonella enterica subsp. enterica serovar Kentucky]|nr:hypothetical protein [Salmonella enterica subsp. enterica serovar Kentucky]
NELAARTEEQASALEETASSMEEISSTVKQNTENVANAASIVLSATNLSRNCGEEVNDVVRLMKDISEYSNKIFEITDVIDSIAFQTNILALNASVEAASYGSSSPPTQRHLPSAQHVVPDSAADNTICCVISLTCDASRRGGKQRYDDFLSVVHFRKVMNRKKIGSA